MPHLSRLATRRFTPSVDSVVATPQQRAIRPLRQCSAVAAVILGVEGVFNGLAGFSFDRHLFSGHGGRAKARVDVLVPKALFEDGERGLACAMRRGYEIDFGVVVKKGRDGFDLIIFGWQEVEAAKGSDGSAC
jgi:hypothetical protein